MGNDMNTLSVIVVALVVIGLVLGVGFLMLEEFQGSIGTTSTTVTNETVSTVALNTCTYVANNHSNTGCYNGFAITSAINSTNATEVIPTTNYTVQSATGCVIAQAGDWAGSDWNITYTYLSSTSEACDGLDDTVNATATIPTWLSIIVILLIVGVLMALIFLALPKLISGDVTGAEGSIAQV